MKTLTKEELSELVRAARGKMVEMQRGTPAFEALQNGCIKLELELQRLNGL